MKAATGSVREVPDTGLISIHAAREGGDQYASDTELVNEISIHAAREGGDATVSVSCDSVEISIHAAREGGDCGNE